MNSSRAANTLLSFFPKVDKARERRRLNAIVPLPRKKPLTAGRTNPPPVDLVPGAAAADFQRRIRPRAKAVVYPPPSTTVLACPGARLRRDEPLTVEDLWRSPGGGPPHIAGADPDDCCSLCLQLLSHPVFYSCGHGHCYTCVRISLEEQWTCPQCPNEITGPPFRVPRFEALVSRIYGSWDTSHVEYDWSGLTFPVPSYQQAILPGDL
ncbi:hypothetical protein C8R47DRAFT_1085000 [Mycena vitilis]|nr:hypothetical protein C8R47DRAFT_1085000 [Mycena vitilis]